MQAMLLGFAHNLSLLLAFVFCYALLLKYLPKRRFGTAVHAVVHGCLFGAAANLAMLMPIPVNSDVIIDNRIAVIALAAPLVGWRACFLALFLASLGRYAYGGLGTWPGITCIILVGLFSSLISRFWSLQRNNLRSLQLLIIGLATVVITLPVVFTLPAPLDAFEVFKKIAIPVAVMYPVSCVVIGVLLLFVQRAVELHDHLMVSENRFRILFESAPDAIIVANAKTGILLDANQHACHLLDRSQEALQGMHQSKIHPPRTEGDGRIGFSEYVNRMRRGDEMRPFEVAFRRPDGSDVPVECSSGLLKGASDELIVGFFRDLRERKRTERALLSAEALTQYIIDTANVLVVVLDAQGHIILFNAFAEKLTGWTQAELQGQDWFEVLCPRDAYPEIWEEFNSIADSGMPEHFANPIKTRSGDELMISWSNSLASHADLPFQTISVGIDITDQQALESQLRQSEKMRAIGQLSGGIAHDFNNQLQIISSLASLLLPQQANEKYTAYVQSILDSCQRSSDLTTKLLAFSRKGSVRNELIAVSQLLADTVSMLERSVDKKIEICFQDNAGEAQILGDASSLENALLNIALNARDAMPAGGRIVIEASRMDVAAGEIIQGDNALSAGAYCVLSISDTGTGFDEETGKRIFEPFFTTKSHGKGTGLGLSAVYGTMQEHNGAVLFETTLGVGSCFKLIIPLASAESASAEGERAMCTEPSGQTRLMMVDDEALILQVMGESLRLHGCTVHTFEEGAKALTWLAQDVYAVDIALVDLNMPTMNGLELIQRLHALRPDLPIILGTGLGTETVDDYIKEHPGISVLCKPFRLESLLELIQSRLAQ